MIWIKRILFILFVLVVLIASTVLFISWKYADDLKQYALDATHSTIVTDLEFDEDVVLSLWKDFPSVAVEISNIRIEDSFGTDTLLNVEKAFVQFNLIKIIQGNISIEGIRVTDGFIKLRRSENDEWNFRVWKEKDDDGEKAKTDFSIEILTLENIHLDYDDREIDLNIQYQFDKSKIKGRFTDGNQRLRFTISGFMERLNTIGSNRVVDLPLNLAGILNINSQDHIYTIEMGNAILAGNEMVLDAEWTKVDGGTSMEMKVNAGNIEPSEFLPKVWPQIPENVKSLELTGKSDLIFSLNGPFTKEHGPQLDATIRMRDGSLVFQNTNVSELNFEGKLYMKDIKRSKAMEVSFDQFSLKTPKGNVKGKGTLTDLSNPRLRLTSSGNTRLEELITVATISEHLQGSGNIAWNIDFEGPLGKDFNTTMAELKQMRWTGSLDLSESQLSFNSSFPPITEFSSQVKMEQNKTSLTNCNGKIGHLKFEGDAVLNGLKEILTAPAKPVVLTGNV
ncbi:MAG: AsmA family protein, partial [Flavobacteriales bacterium]